MKKFKKTIGLLIITSCLLTGCGDPLKGIDASTVYIKKDGSIRSISKESFDKDYYKEDELKGFIEKEVKAQQEKLGEKSISIENFEVKNKEAILNLSYKGISDYIEFTDTQLETGTYYSGLLEDIKLVETKSGTVLLGEPEEADKLHYIKIQDPEEIQILVDGKVLYCSENVEYKEKNLVKAPAKETVFLLYK